jgi:transcriptional regulator with XRE-family HTH domain
MTKSREKNEHTRPAQVFARRVREARQGHGWSQVRLAEELTRIGYQKSRETLTKLERGTYRNASVDDVFALAAALGVAPVHLLVPLDDEAALEVVPGVPVPARIARAWIRGSLQLPISPRIDYRQLPESELVALVEASLTRNMDGIARALAGDKPRESARRIVRRFLAEEPQKEDDDDHRNP